MTGGEDVLHGRPGDRVDQGLEPPGRLDAVVDDDALVIRATQQSVQTIHSQRSCRGVRSGSGRQPPGLQFGGEAGDTPLAGGVDLECPDDVLGAFGVDRDRADLAAVVEAALVEVAELRPPWRSSVDGFLSHSLHHLGGEVLGVELRDGSHDPCSSLPDGVVLIASVVETR